MSCNTNQINLKTRSKQHIALVTLCSVCERLTSLSRLVGGILSRLVAPLQTSPARSVLCRPTVYSSKLPPPSQFLVSFHKQPNSTNNKLNHRLFHFKFPASPSSTKVRMRPIHVASLHLPRQPRIYAPPVYDFSAHAVVPPEIHKLGTSYNSYCPI